jgi:hypothetical protein
MTPFALDCASFMMVQQTLSARARTHTLCNATHLPCDEFLFAQMACSSELMTQPDFFLLFFFDL